MENIKCTVESTENMSLAVSLKKAIEQNSLAPHPNSNISYIKPQNAASIESLLKRQEITLLENNTEITPNAVIDFSKYIYQHYSVLKGICYQIRHAICKKSDSTNFCLIGYKKEEIHIIYDFVKKLYQYGYIQWYSKNEFRKLITFKVTPLTKQREFLKGKWLEIIVPSIVKSILKEVLKDESFEVMENLKIEKKDKTKNELDLVIRINDKLIWIELKSGQYLEHLYKYHQLGICLGVVPDNTFVIAADLFDTATSEILSYNYDYHILGIERFENIFRNKLCTFNGNQAQSL